MEHIRPWKLKRLFCPRCSLKKGSSETTLKKHPTLNFSNLSSLQVNAKGQIARHIRDRFAVEADDMETLVSFAPPFRKKVWWWLINSHCVSSVLFWPSAF